MAPPELGPHSTKLQSIDTGGIQIGVFRISPIIGVVDLNVERLQKGGVWASRCNDPGAYFAQHELRYIGEITERFEERIGSRPEIFRALALALGFALPFLTDSMFVGTQREDFIRRLDKEAGNDLYLQGARYLLTTDPMERKQLRSQLAGDTYQRTEDAMFVLSLFDPQEDEFPAKLKKSVDYF